MFKRLLLASIISFTGFGLLGWFGYHFLANAWNESTKDARTETIKGGEVKEVGLLSASEKGCVYFIAIERDPAKPEIVPFHIFVSTKVSAGAAIAQPGDLVDATVVYRGERPNFLTSMYKPDTELLPWAEKFELHNKELLTYHGREAYPEVRMKNPGMVIKGKVLRKGLYSSTDENGIYLVCYKTENGLILPFFISSAQSAFITHADPLGKKAMVQIREFESKEIPFPWAILFAEYDF